MEVLDGTTIFWLIALGMVVGALAKLAMWDTTIDMVPNLAAGVAGSLVMGGVTVSLQLPGGFLFAMLGSLSILFILNVFHQQSEEVH
ncbi:hypothetical protein [Fodinibius halophilus]|uniref:GlsB/YeaQ/YmgE family stress response membrane protein n=1 Tax=Fodinibius halophilus TaxID=1736908 RepID=A0A6M1TB36_9BACT|nr:hypothetical protein [Fodinibius halophilus]NGP87542.1 hypothetical protein [Fodinibius halophilus]